MCGIIRKGVVAFPIRLGVNFPDDQVITRLYQAAKVVIHPPDEKSCDR